MNSIFYLRYVSLRLDRSVGSSSMDSPLNTLALGRDQKQYTALARETPFILDRKSTFIPFEFVCLSSLLNQNFRNTPFVGEVSREN